MSDIDERPSKIRKVASTDDESTSTDSIAPNSNANSNSNDTTMQLETLIKTEDAPANPESNTTESTTTAPSNEPNPLSKSQLKKRRKQEEWEANKSKRTEFRRIKRKEKQARKAAAQAAGLLPPPPPSSSRRPIQVPVSFLIDCDFESYMMEKEIISLTAQVTRCYSDNRTAVYRGHMGISGWGGKMKERFEGVLAGNFNSWKGVKFMEEGWMEAAGILDGLMRGPEGGKLLGALAAENGLEEYQKPRRESKKQEVESAGAESAEAVQLEVDEQLKSTIPEASDSTPSTTFSSITPNIVYLSSDSENTLTTLSPYTTYVIGGIVDKNRHKGLCYKRACDAGIPTAKLPIGEYMTMQSRTVLTVNHVMEIMIRWLETGDWGKAFLKVIPKRKEAKLKAKEKKGGAEGEEGNEGEDGDEQHEDEEEKSGYESEDGDEGGVSLEAEKQAEEQQAFVKDEGNDTTV
ncbi:uncharacterized protein EAF01_001187 [Botrytis porri]|uniref:tRNA (guanine(9)-N1)-methyltransferase n=1 Tax=Botrytis porri TaxID=87229 RepID=A0A4Z1KU80_9HELO|nr:uncharacterized protein EAF01_001187 [Botrytis porri]KAF7912166.1 hypothetical protein EAF01_001187 [Botrytis porri]TGO88057.1 hypothetical protein BPOR_0187g00180 [Botrytis porri]